MLDSSRQHVHQLQVMQHDSGNAVLHLCLSVSCMAYLARRGSAEQQEERNVIVALMLVEAAALLAHAYSSHKGSVAAGFYTRHRTVCILVLQSIEFAANLVYIPRAFALNVAVSLADGRFQSVLWNSLVSGCASFNVALHCLSMRLPLHIAAPFAAAKLAAGLLMLPQHIAYLCLPQLSSIALRVKTNVDTVYNTAIGLLAGTGSYEAGLPAVAPCQQLALLLWCHACLAALLPLYCLAAMQLNSRQLAGGSRLTLTAAAAAAAEQGAGHVQELCDRGQQAAAGAADGNEQGGSSSRAVAATELPAATAGITQPDHVSRVQQQQQQQQVVPRGGLLSGGLRGCACHIVALFLASCLVWAAVDVGVAICVPQCGKVITAASHHVRRTTGLFHLLASST